MHRRLDTFQRRLCLRLFELSGLILYILSFGWIKKKRTENYENILVLELWGIGDLVMMSVILNPLRENFPKAKITILAKGIAKELFKHDHCIDEFLIFDAPWSEFRNKYAIWKWDWPGILNLAWKLRKNKYDLVIDARGDIRNHFLSYITAAKSRIGYNWTGGEYFLTDSVSLLCDLEELHRVDAWINLAKHLNLKCDLAAPRIVLAESEEAWAKQYLAENGIEQHDFVVGVHPGARNKSRIWPTGRFLKVCEHLDKKYSAKVILFISPDGFCEHVDAGKYLIKLKVGLRKMVAIQNELDLFVCNDGGAMHTAAAVDTALVAIFGPTKREWFGPYPNRDKQTVVMIDNFNCRPCFDYCIYDHPYCITGISVKDAIIKIDQLVCETHLLTNKLRSQSEFCSI